MKAIIISTRSPLTSGSSNVPDIPKIKMSMKNAKMTRKIIDRMIPATAFPLNFPFSLPIKARMMDMTAVKGEKHPQQRISPTQETMPSTMEATL